MTARVNFPFWKSSLCPHPNFSLGAGRGGQPEQTWVMLHDGTIALPVFALLILQGGNHPAATYKTLVRQAVRRRNDKMKRAASSLSSLFSFLHCKPWGASNLSYHDHFSHDKRLRFPSGGGLRHHKPQRLPTSLWEEENSACLWCFCPLMVHGEDNIRWLLNKLDTDCFLAQLLQDKNYTWYRFSKLAHF